MAIFLFVCFASFGLFHVVQCGNFPIWFIFLPYDFTILLKETPICIKGEQNHHINFVAINRNQPYGISSAICLLQNGEWLKGNHWDKNKLGNGFFLTLFTRKIAFLFPVIKKVTCAPSSNVKQCRKV